MPTPFSNKNQPRTSAQDVLETEKNKDWNPNGVLQPKVPAVIPAVPETNADANAASGGDAAEPLKAVPLPAVTADPLGDLAKAKSGLSTPAVVVDGGDPFEYVVQAGAYRSTADAEAQKAKLALLGLDSKVSERDQAGRVVYRVRLGPFSDKAAAERVRAQLQSNRIDNTLVRVQR